MFDSKIYQTLRVQISCLWSFLACADHRGGSKGWLVAMAPLTFPIANNYVKILVARKYNKINQMPPKVQLWIHPGLSKDLFEFFTYAGGTLH